jgi:hypothetical protein
MQKSTPRRAALPNCVADSMQAPTQVAADELPAPRAAVLALWQAVFGAPDAAPAPGKAGYAG